LVLAMAFPTGLAARSRIMADDERMPTVADTAVVARILQTERGWTVAEMLRDLKSPYGITLLTGLEQMATRASTNSPRKDRDESAALIVLEAADVPDPLPSGWRVVRRTAQSATVLVSMRARIDWRAYVVCVQPADGSPERCDDWSWHPEKELFITPLPPGGAGWRGRLRLVVGLRDAEAGFVDQIFMPRMPLLCAGRIVSIPNGELSSDRRHATIAPGAGNEASPQTVTLEWEIDSAECAQFAYDGMIPFFLEGDAATVQTVAAMLRRREGAP
jgi:hypothetical protein